MFIFVFYIDTYKDLYIYQEKILPVINYYYSLLTKRFFTKSVHHKTKTAIPTVINPQLVPTILAKIQNPNAHKISPNLEAHSWTHAICPLSFSLDMVLTNAEQIGLSNAIPKEIKNVKTKVKINPLQVQRIT